MTPAVTLQQIASAYAGDIAAAVARAGLDPPGSEVKGVIVDEHTGLQVLVSLTHRKPARLHVNPNVADPAEYPGAGVLPVEPRYTVAPKLSKLQRQIIGVLDDRTFRKADWIAVKVRRNNDGNLRNALAGLVKKGVAVKGEDGTGYRLV